MVQPITLKTPISAPSSAYEEQGQYQTYKSGNIFQRWFDSGKIDTQNAQIASANDRVFQREMFEKQSAFNASEAQKNRDFEERMSNTAYQRAYDQMRALGLNPYLLASGGASAASTPSGSVATASGGGAYSRTASARSKRGSSDEGTAAALRALGNLAIDALSAYTLGSVTTISQIPRYRGPRYNPWRAVGSGTSLVKR